MTPFILPAGEEPMFRSGESQSFLGFAYLSVRFLSEQKRSPCTSAVLADQLDSDAADGGIGASVCAQPRAR